ncbi:MAG: triose-phosphate isomerase [Eubacteriales bacterium]
MRKPIIAGNWKMNNDIQKTKEFLNEIKDTIHQGEVDVLICPPFISLATAVEILQGTHIKVGAQNMHWETSGAYTGEISGEMLKEMHVEAVIIGHSERREYFNESDETVNKKLTKAIALDLLPIVCVGESLEEREEGIQQDIVTHQVKLAFKGVQAKDVENIVIAYEPIWAIGTGKTATSRQADEVCGWIRETIGALYSKEMASKVRIQYGGSVKAANIVELMDMPNIDGALVGGASLKMEFADLINYKE